MSLKTLLASAVIAGALGVATSAAADTTVINFDDLGHFVAVDTQYAGIDFNGDAFTLQAPNYNSGDYPPHSSPNVLFSSGSGAIELVNLSGSWTSVGAWATNAYYALTLTGYDAVNNVVDTINISTAVGVNAFFSVAGNGITRAVFSGTPDYYTLDDVTLESTGAVPEPATWALMIGGFGLAGAALRRRRAVLA